MTQIITFFCTRSKWHTFLQFIAENKAWRWGSEVFICSLYFLALATIAWIASSTDLSNASFPPLMGKDLNSFILPILRRKTVVKTRELTWIQSKQRNRRDVFLSAFAEAFCSADDARDDVKSFWKIEKLKKLSIFFPNNSRLDSFLNYDYLFKKNHLISEFINI